MKTFRTLFAFMMLAVASFMMVACDKDEPPVLPPEPNPEVDVTFEIEVTNITSNSSLITVTPSKDDVLYYFDNIAKDEFVNDYGSSVAATAEGAFEQMVAMGMTIEEAIETYASRGVDSWHYDGGLSPEEDYVAYAVPISSEGKALAEGQMQEYRTLAEEQPEASDMTFDIQVTDLTSTSAMVTVTPSRDDALYFFDNISKEELMESYNGDVAARTEYVLEYFTSSERPIEEVVAAYASQGEDDFFYSELSPDTDYVIYAVPISSEGKALGAGATYNYRTQKEDEQPEVSDITFEIEVTEVTSTSALVTVTPSRDDVPYYFDVVSKYILTEFYNGDAAAVVEDMFDSLLELGTPVEDLSQYAKTGAISYFYDGDFSPGEEYVAYAFPINEQGDVIAEGATYAFTTLSEGEDTPEASDMTFDIQVTDLTSRGITYTITPSRDDVYYYCGLFLKSEMGQDWGDFIATVVGSIIEAQAASKGLSVAEVVERFGILGVVDSSEVSGLDPNTEYVLYAVPVSSEGKALSKGTTYPFATLSEGEDMPEVSDITFDIQVTDITSTGATCTITPSRDDVYYFAGIASKEDFESDYGGSAVAYVEPIIEALAEIHGISAAEVVASYGFLGVYESSMVGYQPNSEYVVIAVPVSSEGEVLSEGATYTFTTLSE